MENNEHDPAPQPTIPKLVLKLPALKDGKIAPRNMSKGPPEPPPKPHRPPRPPKLKPLKEVLAKLIQSIKKKDAYAFFLAPVDASHVPGYVEMIKQPMDLGTMTTKVERGKYRSLGEFEADFRLVISNAKAFNPPGTIYYAEAERIEAWGLDHMVKAAPTVIQYETEWNIDVENDYESTPMDVVEEQPPSPQGDRSPSVTSQHGPQRRGPRGPYKKSQEKGMTTSLDEYGRMPGAKDGLDAFPPQSDWANMMLALKLKDKRYKTKKERMRIEKEGPPYRADGSLDYTAIEDPFSVLSALVPDFPVSRPQVSHLYPLADHGHPSSIDPSSRANSTQPFTSSFPQSLHLPRTHKTQNHKPTIKKHWNVVRSTARHRAIADDSGSEDGDAGSSNYARPLHTADFGSFSALSADLVDEMRRQNVAEPSEEHVLFSKLRGTLDVPVPLQSIPEPKEYFTQERSLVAERYIRDVVYGGVDGYAFVRSLAEFCRRDPALDEADAADASSEDVPRHPSFGLGKPVSQWVEEQVVDELTQGRHHLVRHVGSLLSGQSLSTFSTTVPPSTITAAHSAVASWLLKTVHDPIVASDPVLVQTALSLLVYPFVTQALRALRLVNGRKLDMAPLMKAADELYKSEEEWEGRKFAPQPPQSGESSTTYVPERPDQLGNVLEFVADGLVRLNQKVRREWSTNKLRTRITNDGDVKAEEAQVKADVDTDEEDAEVRNLRYNLLALSKRAPIDAIAKLPQELVPETLRQFIPTLSPTKPTSTLPPQTPGPIQSQTVPSGQQQYASTTAAQQYSSPSATQHYASASYPAHASATFPCKYIVADIVSLA
ncbi:hypothetical protein FISHEDRAFT_72282 [Fistulina hepatica ATCC 64428]|uniref:Bromo domain-containing protein n=1 Tax=Fistulina hepatica ATCC 64428 TaxID=1128425 RepID=A0A0D7ADZ7_9AGAR|nr:hypothetical protein FISHEDRAFT_72282 [Fistulina hepatica ATCC 64428]